MAQSPVKRKNLPGGNISYIEPYRSGIGIAKFFTNATYGSDMNKNAGFTGTPVGIHNGTDTTLWTASNISGNNFVFNSTAQAYSGTKSIDATSTTGGNEMLLQAGQSYSTGSYVAISGAIYLTGWDPTDDDIEIRLRLNGSNVGTTVNLSTFIRAQEFGAWQRFSVPLTAFSSSPITFNQIVIHTINAQAQSPNYYLDALQLEQTGGVIEYRVEPAAGTIYRIHGFGFGLADNISVADGIAYNKILGLDALNLGIVSATYVNGEFVYTGVIKNHMDFAVYPNVTFNTGGTTASTWITYSVDFNFWGGSPLVLDSRTGDYAVFFVNDDLSGLQYFRILTNGIEEDIIAGVNDYT